MLRSIRILFYSSLVFLVCGAPTIRFQAVRPALVNIPNHIESIGVINRSERPRTTATTIERVITAELPGESKAASQMSIEGFVSFLEGSSRFNIVRSGIELEKEGRAGTFPEPLTWDEVEAICNELNVKSVLALEVFSSDYIIPTNMAIVNVGFRLYDPSQKRIIDQEQFRHEIVWRSQVASGVQALGRLVDKDRAIREASYQAGVAYGKRISPTWYTISRKYYHKPKRNRYLSMGARMMEVNNWDAAIENLTMAVETGNRRMSGRAAHNLAVVYEILGDFESARHWAQNAWGLYRNKDSKNYSYLIGQRISEQRELEYQEME